LQQRYHPLAYWIVASSLHNTTGAPFDALASTLDPIKKVFATRDLDLVLKRLAVFDRRFTNINQKYDWDNWSTDLDFWECVYEALWSGHLVVPSMRHLPPEDRDERLRFLQSFEAAHKDAVGGAWRKVWSFVKASAGCGNRAQVDGHHTTTSSKGCKILEYRGIKKVALKYRA
jgi:hypothetical protein